LHDIYASKIHSIYRLLETEKNDSTVVSSTKVAHKAIF
jgi:hypothetical protein